ncbi:hypothetical protein EMIT0P260_180079 [Pseudomonas sp. IT-P260]
MGDEQASQKYPVRLLTFLVIEINLTQYIVLSLFLDGMAKSRPKNLCIWVRWLARGTKGEGSFMDSKHMR